MQFRVIVVTDPPTHKHTHRQDRLQYTAPQLVSMQCNHSMSALNAYIIMKMIPFLLFLFLVLQFTSICDTIVSG